MAGETKLVDSGHNAESADGAQDAAGPETEARTDQPAVILVRPQLGENIGAAARAMANFGLSDMRIIDPRDGWPNEAAERNASKAPGILQNAHVTWKMNDGISDLHYLVGTTARARDMVKPVLTPHDAILEIRRQLSLGKRCGILFGPERTGLENDELALADALVVAPVNPKFASLNLGQAVLLLAYEWMVTAPGDAQSLGRKTATDGLASDGAQFRKSQPATRAELTGFFEHLERELDAKGFFRTPASRAGMIRNLRNIFTRTPLTEQEVRTLRGVISSLVGAHKPKP